MQYQIEKRVPGIQNGAVITVTLWDHSGSRTSVLVKLAFISTTPPSQPLRAKSCSGHQPRSCVFYVKSTAPCLFEGFIYDEICKLLLFSCFSCAMSYYLFLVPRELNDNIL